jgi:hypothetical protein
VIVTRVNISVGCAVPVMATGDSQSYIPRMQIELSDEQAALLARELRGLIDSDRFFLSPRVRTLQEILDMIRPQPIREPPPALRNYEPPKMGRYRRRR